MSFLTAQLQNFNLAGSGVSIADTTMTLSSFKSIDGVNLALSDFGSAGYMTIEPGSRDREEQIAFYGVTQNSNGTATLTGIKTVLFLSPYTESSGFAKSHPGGVVAVVTNTSGFYNKLTAKDNQENITGYWTVPDPLSATGIANKEYVDNLVNGGTVSTNALIEVGTAGETVAAGNPVYLKAADGRWYKAIGTTANTVDVIQLGIAQGAGTAGNAISGGVLRRGVDTHQSGGSAGAIGYISNTSTIATSAGTVERAVGNFATTTTFVFDPQFYYGPTANQKAALVGTNGTPSSTNKYVTLSGSATPTVQVYTASNTWTKPAGLVYAVIEVVGGGGGGGGSSNSNGFGGWGGGGGGYSKKTVAVASLGATETVTVGAAGAAGTSTGTGGDGGTSSFGSHASATGGFGGGLGSATNAGSYSQGGIGSSGNINISGSDGSTGSDAADAGGSDGQVPAGTGGASFYGGGGMGARGGSNSAGLDGNIYGGGGGGGKRVSASSAGGAGAAGLVVVTEHFV